MTRLQRLAVRLVDGSGLLTRRLAGRAAAWIRAGRRDDLTGFAAVLGCWVRLGLVVAGLWVLWRVVRAAPALLWALVPVWVVASLRIRPEPTRSAPQASTVSEGDEVEAVRALLFEVMGDRPAVHLSTVVKHLQKEGHHPDWTVTDLRVRLGALGIPHDRRVKVGRVPTWGVRRRDLEAPSPDDGPGPSPTSSTAV
ncbi:hypothetical protein GCM10011583_11800 [Streptomyces camponoticapitis]|uniref:Uncharacterized protein n=1 Tax=Streptomyces camponoticapitis TaxID=1616125 RepID=A0ABQ2E222_9ACTN|nr:hypothetical protein [Streptomyces camponoticapitis]GGJ81957.1 hypothetical protein GCM10011583_11800 [Streptomyces camponoticapitis]